MKKSLLCIMIILFSFGSICYASDRFNEILPGTLVSKITAKADVACRPVLVENKAFWAVREANNTVLYSADAESGKILWRKELRKFSKLFPLIRGHNKIFFPVNTRNRGLLYAFNAKTGDILWTFEGRLLRLTRFPPFIDFGREFFRYYPLLADDDIIYLVLG